MSTLANSPLLGTLDCHLFVEPPLMSRLLAAVRRELNVLVLGDTGSGKTSLLRRLAAEDTGNELARRRVYVDLGPAADAEQALALIAEALGVRDALQAWADAVRAPFTPATTSSSSLLRLARRLNEANPAVILVDSPPGHGEAHRIFGRLRDELWQFDHRWIVAANANLRDELTRPPAAAFFDVQLELAPLPDELQRDLLRRRLADEPHVDVDALVGKTDGLPRSLVTLARDVVLAGGTPDGVLRRRERVQARLAQLPASARTITEYLSTHGATSGSDPALLGVLGVSGQRARQVLRDLEDEGLVRSFTEQQERRGRPRKLYELVNEAR